MQHLLGHAAEQELGDPGPATSTDNDEIRRDLLRSREMTCATWASSSFSNPSGCPRRRRQSPDDTIEASPPPAMFVVSRPAFSATSPASRGPSLEGARLREARSPQSPCPGWHPIRARWPASRTWMSDAQCWFSHGACNGRASCAFDSQKRSDRDDDAVPIVAEAALRGWIN